MFREGSALLPLPIISVAIGGAILLFGRKLFWLFVAAVGFAAGVEITARVLQHPPMWLAIALALGLGLLGALLAIFLQKAAIAIAGFLTGGAVALAAFNSFATTHVGTLSLPFLIGGVIGAVLLLILFDWALIVLSSIGGAHLVVSVISMAPTGATVLTVALAVFGIVVQVSMMRRHRET